MIDLIKKLIPWRYSLPANRNLAHFTLTTEAGCLRKQSALNWYADLLTQVLQTVGISAAPPEFAYLSDGITSVDQLKPYIQAGNFEDNYLYGAYAKQKFAIARSEIAISFIYRYGPTTDICGITAPCSEILLSSLDNFVRSLSSSEFLVAECYDDRYVNLQNTGPVSKYRYTGGLKLRSSDRVDLSDRPGRGAVLPGTKFGLFSGSAHFWFGGMTFEKFLPKEKILSFHEAEEISELPNGALYVQLYADMFKGHEPEAQRRQLAFRNHLGLV